MRNAINTSLQSKGYTDNIQVMFRKLVSTEGGAGVTLHFRNSSQLGGVKYGHALSHVSPQENLSISCNIATAAVHCS